MHVQDVAHDEGIAVHPLFCFLSRDHRLSLARRQIVFPFWTSIDVLRLRASWRDKKEMTKEDVAFKKRKKWHCCLSVCLNEMADFNLGFSVFKVNFDEVKISKKYYHRRNTK